MRSERSLVGQAGGEAGGGDRSPGVDGESEQEVDLVELTRHYRSAAGSEVADRFFDALFAALRSIERMPGIGSLRLGELCDIAGLRFQRIAEFPCGWLDCVRSDHLDVERLLADTQDLTAILDELRDE